MKKVIGDIGINAIKSKTIKVNNTESAIHAVDIKGISLEEFIKVKAKELGFKYLL